MTPRPEQQQKLLPAPINDVSNNETTNSNKRLKTAATTTTTTTTTNNNNNSIVLTPEEANIAIESFQKLLSYETVSATAPDTGAYKECAAFLIQELKAVPVLSDNISILEESPTNSPVVVTYWKGRDENLPVILLNSHYDVVPVLSQDWTVPAFEGLRQNGNIYGRGTQDMKSVCVQYIYAIRKLVTMYPNFVPERSIYLTFVPDEEVGGSGMAAFLESQLYKSLPGGIALALDEGLASTTNTYSVFFGERLPWWVDVTATGNTGHGSRFIDNTAVEQLIELTNRALAFRQGQRNLLGLNKHENCAHAVAAANQKKNKSLGDVTSLNITTLQAGVQVADTYAYNCVPPVAKCSLDIRISPHVEPQEIATMLDTWCQECSSAPDAEEKGHGLKWNYISGNGNDLQKHAITETDETINPWYGVFRHAMTDMGLSIDPQVFPAATDSRFLRALGIRALGFSPMRNTEVMLHENDEYIPERTFLEGIGVYVGIIHALGSQGKKIDMMDDDAAAVLPN